MKNQWMDIKQSIPNHIIPPVLETNRFESITPKPIVFESISRPMIHHSIHINIMIDDLTGNLTGSSVLTLTHGILIGAYAYIQ